MRVGLYGRESRDNKASVRDQIAAGQRWCLEEQHEVVATYQDGSSASRFASKARSDWPKLLADVKTGRFDILWLWESSRGDRTPETWFAFLTACREHDVLLRVDSHDRTYNVANWRDWRTLAEDGVDSATESEKLSARVRRGVVSKAAQGRPHGRNQYGYVRHYDSHTGELASITVHEEQAAVITEAARRLLAGESTYAVAKDFNDRGLPTPRSGRWTAIPLARLLNAPWTRDGSELDLTLREAERRARSGEDLKAIAEDFTERGIPGPRIYWTASQLKPLVINPSYNGKRSHQGKVVGPAIWPAIIDDDTHARLVAKLTDPARGLARDRAVKHLLSGIARCGCPGCGAGMRVLPNRGSLSYYCPRCYKTGRLVSKTDLVVERAVIGFLQREDCRDVLSAPEDGNVIQDALTDVASLRARLDGFYDQAAAGELSPTGLARVEQRLLADIAAAEGRTRRLGIAPAVDAMALKPGEDPAVVAERWERLSTAQKRDLITQLAMIIVLPVGRGKRTFNPASIRVLWRHEEPGPA